MRLKLKEETWYSRLAFLIFTLGIFPIIVYILGMNHATFLSEVLEENGGSFVPAPEGSVEIGMFP